jgi:hydrogenase nickel incorporation protein HypB
MSVISVQRKILEKNDEIARYNRKLFQRHGIFSVNIVSSPGAGKTTILETSMERLKADLSVAVVEGDVQTDLDARRVARLDVPVVQVVTRGGCHLEARLVQQAMRGLDLDRVRLLIIENVGNLVCPASFDLGEDHKVVVLSITEGADKPLKYPSMFREAAVLLINKIDLLPYVNCDLRQLTQNALDINPQLTVFPMSATTGEGVDAWCQWLKDQCSRQSVSASGSTPQTPQSP